MSFGDERGEADTTKQINQKHGVNLSVHWGMCLPNNFIAGMQCPNNWLTGDLFSLTSA